MTLNRKRKAGLQLHERLSPAVVLVLMSGIESGTTADDHYGRPHDSRAFQIPGAWDLFSQQGDHMRGTAPDPLDVAWQAHGQCLTAEATGYGFRPYFTLTDEDRWSPDEAAAERRWRDRFLTRHGRDAVSGRSQ